MILLRVFYGALAGWFLGTIFPGTFEILLEQARLPLEPWQYGTVLGAMASLISAFFTFVWKSNLSGKDE